MTMYVHNIDPTLLHIGPLEIRYYGLVYVLGFIASYYVLIWYQKKGYLELKKDDVENLLLYIMLGVILGSRLGEVFWEPAYYLSNPINILKIWEGGMSFHGGLIGVIIAVYYFSRKYKIGFLEITDIIAIPAVIALAFGRIANFINGELWGTVTNVPWCVQFKNAEGCRHPVQLYAAFGRFVAGGILILLARSRRKTGFISFAFLTLIGIGRFFSDFLREDPRLFGLSLGQYLSLAMAIAGIYILAKSYREELINIFKRTDVSS
ncbi:prolipoprotein diacylglyceryl transferase [Candidatus Woesearchaeota archaeon]|nr:prolipoprotein diacylglyceryl transferase [Candidatus Woesearchaeota archaeon]